MGRFTRNDARSVIFNFVSADVADTAETLYGSDDDLKNLDGHRFYQILMDAKNCTLSDPDTGVAMPVDTNFGAYRLYSFYKGLIWNVAKSTLVSEKLPDNIVATKEDEVRNFALKAFLMLSGEADKEDKIPDVYKSFDPEKVNWDVASGFANWLKMTLLTLARGVWKQSAEAGGDALSLEDFTTNDEGEDNSDRNAALAVEDHSDKTLVNTIFDNFIERVENGEIPEIRKTTLDIFKHARPFFNTPKDSNHMIYANYKRLLDTDAAKEIVQKALDQGKTKKQAILARRNYLIARAFETALKSYSKYNRDLTAQSLVADESIPFEAYRSRSGKASQAAGFRLGYYGFPTRYLEECKTEEEKEAWQKAYKFLLKDISWRMSNEALKYIKDHPEDFDILTEAEQQIVNLYDALRLVEYYIAEIEAGRGDDFSMGKIVEAMNATGLTSLQESAMRISLDIFTGHLHEKNANYAALLDLMREYPEDNTKVMECLDMDEKTYKTALHSIREDFKAFLN